MAKMVNLGTFYGDNARAFDLYCCVDCGTVFALTLGNGECVVCGLLVQTRRAQQDIDIPPRVGGHQ